jgi:KDO2-lipid IV(A) palmitoleoyltransferase
MRIIITLWQCLCHLPTSWHPLIGKLIGKFLFIVAKDRKRIAQANISLCLPNLSAYDQKKILNDNFMLLGKSIMETGIAWFWSDAKIKKLINYEIFGLDLLSVDHSSKGNLIIFKHSQHLELDARLMAINAEIYGVSRAHNSALMNKIQNKGRLSSIKDTADKNNPRQFMKWLKDGKNVLYAIDQDYGWDHSVKLKFFNQETATITTPKKIIDFTGSNLLFMNSYYEKNKIVLKLEALNSFGIDDKGLAQKINDFMEEKILLHPAEYLWAHRRFKSTLGKSFYK